MLDTCRADRMGCYGYSRPTSPTIDALAADPDAVLFERHYAQGVWTKPSTASLFTGLFVHQHGVVLGIDRVDEAHRARIQVLPEAHETLAERLARLGYTTIALTAIHHLLPDYGFAQGISSYFGYRDVRDDRSRVERFLDVAARSPGKFFAYLHLSACHKPYRLEDRDAAYMERFGFPYDEAGRRSDGLDFTDTKTKARIRRGEVALDETDLRYLHLVYEAQLARVDRKVVAPLIEGLKNQGLYDDTLLIVTADHGEELFDHGDYGHGTLWDEVIHVPLIMKFPKGRRPSALPSRVEHVTRQVDLLPSLVQAVGGDPPDDLPGVAILAGETPGFAIAEVHDDWAYIESDWKLVKTREGMALYDLCRDPGETIDRAASEAAEVARLSEAYARVRSRHEPAPALESVDSKLDEEDREHLRSLGYLP